MTTPNNNKLYVPTPMEEAFGLYILQRAFPSSYTLYSNQGSIHIPGQDAVAFLTKSGIHRLILRNVWNVADPDNEGTLLHIEQLHAILRLVALAQAGHVDNELLSVGKMPPPKPTPTQVLIGILTKTVGQMCPLAQFESIPQPSQPELQQIYQQEVVHKSPLGSIVADVNMATSESVSPTPSEGLSNQWQPPQSTSPPPPSFTQPAQREGMSAFDALGGVEDQPLPNLAPPQSERGMGGGDRMSPVPQPSIQSSMSFPEIGGTSADGDVFNGINKNESNRSHYGAGTSIGDFAMNAPSAANDDDPFGDFSAAGPAPAPTPQIASNFGALDSRGMQQQNILENAAGQGTFGDPALPQQQEVSGFNTLDSLGPSGNAPLQTLDSFANQQQQPQQTIATEVDDDFGDFSDAAAPGSVPTEQQEVSGFEALDSLGPIGNATLPAFHSFVQREQQKPQETTITAGDDDFGDFSEAVTAPVPVPTEQQEVSGFDALDSLGTSGNAPLPTLDNFVQQQQPQQITVSEVDDDFGDFSDAAPGPVPAGQQELSGFGALDSLGPSGNAPLPALNSFAQLQQPQQTTATKGDDDSRDFSDAAPNPVAAGQQEVSGFDGALDFLGSTDNVPQSGLEAIGQQQPKGDIVSDDAFCGFSDDTANPNGFDALDSLGLTKNVRSPMGDFVKQPEMQNTAEEDGFQDFSGATPVAAFPKNGSTDVDALDAFGHAVNAPLPSAQRSSMSDVFGDQAEPLPKAEIGNMGQPQSDRVLSQSTSRWSEPNIQPSFSFPRSGNNDISENNNDAFSAFDTLAGNQQDAPMPSLVGLGSAEPDSESKAQMEDSFGSFTAAEEGNQEVMQKRRLSGGLHHSKHKNNNIALINETMPKDLRPHLPGEHYGRSTSLRKLEERDRDDDDDPETESSPTFDLPTTAKPAQLREPSSLGPVDETLETLPQDLKYTGHTHYVPHSPHEDATPSGLETLREPVSGEDEDHNVNIADPFNVSMPHDLLPHGPNKHYVPHSPRADKTPGGLSTLGEEGEEEDDWGGFEEARTDSQAASGPTDLLRAENAVTSGNKSAPSIGIAGEEKSESRSDDPFAAFAPPEVSLAPLEFFQETQPRSGPISDAGLSHQAAGDTEAVQYDERDDWGTFEQVNASVQAIPPPAQLTRQATPAPGDLNPQMNKKAVVENDDPIPEGQEPEEEVWGTFEETSAGMQDLPRPAQLSRQATPPPGDLNPEAEIKDASRVKLDAVSVPEEDKSESDTSRSNDPFAAFAPAQPSLPSLNSFSEIQPNTESGECEIAHQASPTGEIPSMDEEKARSDANVHESQVQDDEDWGTFEEASAGKQDMPSPPPLLRQATPAPEDLSRERIAFRDRASGPSTIREDEEDVEDVFGNFAKPSSSIEDVSTSNNSSRPKSSDSHQSGLVGKSTVSLTGDDDDDDDENRAKKDLKDDEEFGDFTSFSAQMDTAPPPASLNQQAIPATKNAESFKPTINVIGSTTIEEGGNEFGMFAEGSASKQQEAGSDTVEVDEGRPDEDIDFEFGSFEEGIQQLQQSLSGSFGFDEASAPTPAPAFLPAPGRTEMLSADDSFSDFATFSSSPTPAPAPTPLPISNEETFGDFAAFEETSATVQSDTTQELKGKIISLSASLPESFRGSLDFAKLFDVRILGAQTFLNAECKKRAQRCVDLLLLSSTSHKKLVSTYWMQVISVVDDELSLGRHLLEEASSSLSAEEKQVALKTLEIFVSALGEYIRIIRSIVASLGDIMLLDVSTPFDSASNWGSSLTIERALQVEKLWEDIEDKSSALRLQRQTKVESVAEIRTKCLERYPATTLCHFSLQPLSEDDQQTTKMSVEWDGKQYMACSANLLANRCPFYMNDF